MTEGAQAIPMGTNEGKSSATAVHEACMHLQWNGHVQSFEEEHYFPHTQLTQKIAQWNFTKQKENFTFLTENKHEKLQSEDN